MIRKLLALANDQGRRRLRMLIATIVVTAVLQGCAFVALVPFLTALFTGDTGHAGTWLAVLAVIAVLYAIVFWLGSKVGQAAATDVLTSLLDRLGDRLIQLPLGWFATDRSGELADTATRGIVFASTAPYSILRPMLTAYLTPATVLVGAVFIDWRIAVTMTVAAPVIWLVHRWLAGRIAVADRAHSAAVAEASARLIEFARAQPALRAALDDEHNSIARRLVDDALATQHSANRKVTVTGGAGIGMFGGVVQLTVTAVIVVGTWLALDGALAVANLVALLVLAVRFTEPVIHSGALGGGIGMASNTLDRIQALLHEPMLPEPAVPREPDGWDVRFSDVTFGYNSDQSHEPVLRDLSFTAPAGAMTAIVGPSGSGKTTIVRLMARFHDPEHGTVSIGGVPLPELGSTRVAAAVSPVFQDVYLFDGTILDNIWLGDPAADRAAVVRAGELARVDEICERLPDGWDTRVGEGGTNLSGGERQRVSIARALLKDAPVVLLDEATTALDIDNETAIQEALAVIRRDRTLVVVAHRLHTISSADHIVMLDGRGGIAEQGSHDELLAHGHDYARYWHERVHAAGWRLTDSPASTA
ncbi:ABC transporter ATP-binding protein [Kibdelosporangium persicum]|uniref:ABC iron siderophore transporter n=1 Tax=Kibdelosporangium persicum TaxID=2698649 RepID=A0ABX2FE09_9PSEU|nr:ABC transporter ATP-binding protein [Kibdelosporangium persicum]NRN69453.1 ABC iron siderophore transporter [Kibdelosporangium persicum]